MSQEKNQVLGTQPLNQEGRSDMEAFAESMEVNAFEADAHLQRILPLYTSEARLDGLVGELKRFGAEVSGPVDALVRKNNEAANLPRLERWTEYGTRIEKIDHHPTYHEAGRYIYGSGVMAAYADHPNSIGALSRFYVSSFNGEAGHNCPVACTAGAIRVLQELGTPELKEKYLPGLLNRDYKDHVEGAQFLTEIQGGSDVGSNDSRAERNDDGTWRIFGEKWFCSNIDADIFLMTARPDGAPEGTRGLGLFLVPREHDDGSVNEFYIRRLKDKLGTRSMASGECDFRGATAHHMGSLEEGFKNMMNLVINTSRLYNAVGTCGVMRKAFVIGQSYARHRRAFGPPIIDYPLVQETLANVKAEIDACVSGSFHLVGLQDRLDRGEGDDDLKSFFRVALNINKARTARSGTWACVQGIEILGGNGAIESFSILPRLLRDSIVYENWEGTHNTLYMQVLKDMHKYRFQEGFVNYLRGLIQESSTQESSTQLADELDLMLSGLEEEITAVLSADPASASLAMRPLADRMCDVMYATIRVWERSRSQVGDDDDDLASLEHFFDLRLRTNRKASTKSYLARLSRVARS
ncbi:MAG: acyl-CoA dehydrogenase family protein [Bradymonadaceae bacterium]